MAKGRKLEDKNPAQQQHAENKVSKYRKNFKKVSGVGSRHWKGEKKNLNKCKSIQSCLLQDIKYFPAALRYPLSVPGLRGALLPAHAAAALGQQMAPRQHCRQQPGASERQHLANLSRCLQLLLFCPQLNLGRVVWGWFPPPPSVPWLWNEFLQDLKAPRRADL